MKNRNKLLCMVALAVGSTIFTIPVLAHQDQDHQQQRDNRNDRYANNDAYKQGIREGFEDHDGHHKRKKPHFDKKEDRNAYNVGYKHGSKGEDQYRPH